MIDFVCKIFGEMIHDKEGYRVGNEWCRENKYKFDLNNETRSYSE